MDCQSFMQNQQCTQCNENRLHVASENRREYRLENPSQVRICKVRIDGCFLADSQEKKCDFLFIICESGDSYFVELKGRHLLEGIEQIATTLDHFASQIRENHGRVFARIVVTEVHRPKAIENDVRIIRLRKQLKQSGGDLVYQSRRYTDVI